MKRFIFLVVVMGFLSLFMGCTGLQSMRTVDENNIFISLGRPKLKVKVNKNFKYTEQANSSDSASSFSGGESTTNEKSENYIFDDTSKEGRRLIITVSSLNSSRWFYMAPLLGKNEALDAGKINFNDKEYEYRVDLYTSGKDPYILKTIAKRSGAKNNSKLIIYYLEYIEGEWSNSMSQLSRSQRERLAKFNKNFLESFEIL